VTISTYSAKSDGWTSLHVASERGYVDIVTLLLEKGAAIDSATPDGINIAFPRSHMK
jgi:ankyrin repeat protein